MFRKQRGIEAGLSLLVSFPDFARGREGSGSALRGDVWASVGGGDEPAQVGVPGNALRKEGEMRAISQSQFGAGDGCDIGCPRSSCELHSAVESIVIGDC